MSKFVVAAFLCITTSACAQPPPECRVAADAPDQRIGNAGCLIAVDGQSLLLVHNGGGKLGFPGGTSRDAEPAQCTAHRETWEETGLDVEVGVLLKRLSTGFLLYACEVPQSDLSPERIPELPFRSRGEVTGLVWRDLDAVPAEEWRFPDQVEEIRGLDDP